MVVIKLKRFYILLFCALFGVYNGHAQDNLLKRKVSLKAGDEKLENILLEISDIANFTFSYDASILARNNDSIFKGSYFQGFGLGVRLRNDNLTFNAIDVRLGFYPNGPEDVGSSGFNLSELSRKPFNDFDVTAPDITPFQ